FRRPPPWNSSPNIASAKPTMPAPFGPCLSWENGWIGWRWKSTAAKLTKAKKAFSLRRRTNLLESYRSAPSIAVDPRLPRISRSGEIDTALVKPAQQSAYSLHECQQNCQQTVVKKFVR